MKDLKKFYKAEIQRANHSLAQPSLISCTRGGQGDTIKQKVNSKCSHLYRFYRTGWEVC